jgi:hypothetical protein
VASPFESDGRGGIELEWSIRLGPDADLPQVVRWTYRGVAVEKAYDHGVRSAVVLRGENAVLIVEPATFADEDDAGDNAVIFEANGEQRMRLRHPRQPRWPYSRARRAFDQAFYAGDDLQLIVHDHGSDYRCTLDLSTGAVAVLSEWR